MHGMEKQIQKTSNFLVKRSMKLALMHTTNIYPPLTIYKVKRSHAIKKKMGKNNYRSF